MAHRNGLYGLFWSRQEVYEALRQIAVPGCSREIRAALEELTCASCRKPIPDNGNGRFAIVSLEGSSFEIYGTCCAGSIRGRPLTLTDPALWGFLRKIVGVGAIHLPATFGGCPERKASFRRKAPAALLRRR